MKKNNMMRLASILLVLVLLTTSVISGTFAKYTTEANSTTDTAKVAKWNVLLNGEQMTAAHTFTFDLFNTVIDTKNDATETDIATADGSIIAPGTKGQMSFELKNFSEVVAEYTIDYSITNNENIPVVFSLDGADWKNSIDELDVTTPVNMPIGDAKTVTVYWMWAFNGDDAKDTGLGLKGTDTISVTAKVIATQVD